MNSWLYDVSVDFLRDTEVSRQEKLKWVRGVLQDVVEMGDEEDTIDLFYSFLGMPRRVDWKQEGF